MALLTICDYASIFWWKLAEVDTVVRQVDGRAHWRTDVDCCGIIQVDNDDLQA